MVSRVRGGARPEVLRPWTSAWGDGDNKSTTSVFAGSWFIIRGQLESERNLRKIS